MVKYLTKYSLVLFLPRRSATNYYLTLREHQSLICKAILGSTDPSRCTCRIYNNELKKDSQKNQTLFLQLSKTPCIWIQFSSFPVS